MRLYELTEGSYRDDMVNAIVSLLAVATAEGISAVSTPQLVTDLRELGFSIDEDSVVDVLDGIGLVTSADSETIEISSEKQADTFDADPVDDISSGDLDMSGGDEFGADEFGGTQPPSQFSNMPMPGDEAPEFRDAPPQRDPLTQKAQRQAKKDLLK